MADTSAATTEGTVATIPDYPMPRVADCPFDPPPALRALQKEGPITKVRSRRSGCGTAARPGWSLVIRTNESCSSTRGSARTPRGWASRTRRRLSRRSGMRG